MTRKFFSTKKFDKQLKALDIKIQKQALKTLQLFIQDPSHPSLRYKKVQGAKAFYEISVNMSVRIIIEVKTSDKDQLNTFYVLGGHEDVF